MNLHFMKQCIAIFSKIDVSRNRHLHGAHRPKVGLSTSYRTQASRMLTGNAVWAQVTLGLWFRIFTPAITEPAEKEETCHEGCSKLSQRHKILLTFPKITLDLPIH